MIVPIRKKHIKKVLAAHILDVSRPERTFAMLVLVAHILERLHPPPRADRLAAIAVLDFAKYGVHAVRYSTLLQQEVRGFFHTCKCRWCFGESITTTLVC
jgi:hypothetical protein